MKHIKMLEEFDLKKTTQISTKPTSSTEFMSDISKELKIPIKQSIEEIYSYHIEKNNKWALDIINPKMKMSGYIEAEVRIWLDNRKQGLYKQIRTERVDDIYKFLQEFDFS